MSFFLCGEYIKLKHLFFFLICFLGAQLSYAKDFQAVQSAPEITGTLTILDNQADHFKLQLTLRNNSNRALNQWVLHFNMIRPIAEVSGAIFNAHEVIGDYYQLKADPATSVWGANQTLSFILKGSTTLKNLNDIPRGYFVTDAATVPGAALNIQVTATNFPLLPTYIQAKRIYEDNQSRLNLSGEMGAGTVPGATKPLIGVIPKPVYTQIQPGHFLLTATTPIVVTTPLAVPSAQFFTKAIKPATQFNLNTQSTIAGNESKIPMIIFKKVPSKIAEYRLSVSPKRIIVSANDETGFFYAVQTLRQLLPVAAFSENYQPLQPWRIPAVEIWDFPRFNYRGLSLDVSRHFRAISEIKKILDEMALLKLNTLHWHLADDEGWRVAIDAFPALTKIGAWRGVGLALPPAYGSGARPYGGFYTYDELQALIVYAQERYITIIPEIDMPGHSRALLKSLPNLQEPDDQSQYSSAQNSHDNVLNPCLPQTYVVAETILREISRIFPSEYIHMGGDEKPAHAWERSPACLRSNFEGTGNADALQTLFEQKISKILNTLGKKMAGWEEIAEGPTAELPLNTRIYAWQSAEAGIAAARKGYDVVMTPAQHYYFDLAYDTDSREIGYYWAGYVDTFNVYNYDPLPGDLEPTVRQHILGIQGAIWSENLPNLADVEYMTFPKIVALAEAAWTPQADRSWPDFASRLGYYFLPILSKQNIQYRLPTPGLLRQDGLIYANVAFPGLGLRYGASIYKDPIPDNSAIEMQSFDPSEPGRGSAVSRSTEN